MPLIRSRVESETRGLLRKASETAMGLTPANSAMDFRGRGGIRVHVIRCEYWAVW